MQEGAEVDGYDAASGGRMTLAQAPRNCPDTGNAGEEADQVERRIRLVFKAGRSDGPAAENRLEQGPAKSRRDQRAAEAVEPAEDAHFISAGLPPGPWR